MTFVAANLQLKRLHRSGVITARLVIARRPI